MENVLKYSNRRGMYLNVNLAILVAKIQMRWNLSSVISRSMHQMLPLLWIVLSSMTAKLSREVHKIAIMMSLTVARNSDIGNRIQETRKPYRGLKIGCRILGRSST